MKIICTLDLLLHRVRTCWRLELEKSFYYEKLQTNTVLIQQMKETQTHVPTENNIQLHERSVNMPRFQAFVKRILLINTQQQKKNPFKNENQFKNITSLTLRVSTTYIRTCFQKSRFLYSGFCRMIFTNLRRKLMFIFYAFARVSFS